MKILSKDQMKKIMGGVGEVEEPGDGGEGVACTKDKDCKKHGSNCYCLTAVKKCGCVTI